MISPIIEMCRQTLKPARLAVAAAALAPVLAFSGAAGAAETPFSAMAGAWSGAGKIMMSNGSQERIRCRATYAVGAAGTNLQQNLKCASDSFNFELQSNVSLDGSALSGTWNETTRKVAGRVSGRVQGNAIQALVEASGFSAELTMVTQAGRQSVAIKSQRQEFAGVAITLNRN